ncbi:PEP/pyruvate-binding domain-containing protein [Streptomyces sp. BE303]|uniref:PEP/pyruvate-binding domain-containing protein n=1 Tax=Streptomyces sp. BE303 TaxID=3002528 RepID=UPI002E75EA9B|nr:PEP/pyruvate-binding domain-containing protein [Streptomyces sp. BE303]MED7950414.1 PEP/pyruvate-binding domain-containing protein [Streptomyces sp. BE303]
MTTALPCLDEDLHCETAGAKATALARLAAAGLPVPAGVVVPAGHPEEQLATAASEILARCPAPYGLIARSSATTEDGPDASFAGLFTSRIAPAEPTALLEAVRAVRASAHHPTVSAYGQAMGVTRLPRMAVLVQAALRPACSGVLAADVTDARCTRWRIEAVRGLAEPLVSGNITGEIHTGRPGHNATVLPARQEIIQLPAAAAESTMPPGEWLDLGAVLRAKLQTSAAGVLHLYTPAALADRPILSGEARRRLLDTAAQAAAVLGLERVDVEWVIGKDGRLHLVQARPLTAPLTDPAAPRTPADDDGRVLHGIAAAPGAGTGTAVHAFDDTGIAGQVLVCDALGPEAVPALLTGPAAVVATTGGELSHTAIITRELGIPCVTNVTDARTAITSGTTVEVDGGAGTVRPALAVPAQRTAPTARPLTATAVLVRTLEHPVPAEGRAATLLWHAEHTPATAPAGMGGDGPYPVGVLVPGDLTALVTVPPGYGPIRLPGLGTLLWPQDAPPPPTEIAVLGPGGQVLHRRTVTR